MIYFVRVLTHSKKGFKTLKRFKTYEKAKEYFNECCKENPGAGYFIQHEEGVN